MIAMQPADALSLAAGSVRLSYGELNARSAALAQRLQVLGAGRDVPVAVCANRSPAAVVASLAVLKAGAAYVPLDPAHPAERLEFMLRDVGAPLVVADRAIAERVPAGSWKVVYLDDAPVPHGPREQSVSPDPASLAYIIYTSGSTGRPKGVAISHGSLLNLIRWHRRAFSVTAADRASQIAAPGFDAAVWEVWPYLTAGASLHFPSEITRGAAPPLRDWLLAEQITIAFAPTALAEQMIALPWPGKAALRFLLTGGEALRRYPPPGLPFVLVNNYGPTETTVVATSCVVPPGPPLHETPPIGQAIDNVLIVILDERLNPVHDGQPGELCIGGASLARGYVNQPELTAQKFISGLFSSQPARWYRTGDLVRRLPDGQIAFLGRLDDQIEIRGFRVEPGEIESALSAHPEIRISVAIAREDTPDDKRLVAYVVPVAGAAPSIGALEDLLRRRLPAYMMPAAIVSVRELPLTPNGKVDRAALPAPPRAPEPPVRDGVAPRLAKIMSRLLELKEVAYDDNFFLLGGHSLLGAQVLAQVRETFGVTLTLRQLFEAPTVSQLAAEIERAELLASDSK
jgi:amino acid adenylation domain-containing protein